MLGAQIYDRLRVTARSKRLASAHVSEPELRLVKRLLNPGDTAVDVGAYAGEYAYEMSRVVGTTGTVYAFEPHHRYSKMLIAVLQRLLANNVRVVETALSDSVGHSHIVFADDKGKPLHGEVHLSEMATLGSEPVSTSTLDVEIDPEAISGELGLIKIDVEGAELGVLNGARNILAQFKPAIICEVEERHCVRFGHTKSDVLSAFESAGY